MVMIIQRDETLNRKKSILILKQNAKQSTKLQNIKFLWFSNQTIVTF